jgi:putative membrane protein
MSDPRRPFEVAPDTVRRAGVENSATRLAPAELIVAATRPAPAPVPALPAQPLAPRPRRMLAKVFGASAVAFALGAIGYQLWAFVADVLVRSVAVGTALAVTLGVAVASGGFLLLREVLGFSREMRKLREVEALSREAAAVLAANGHGRALALSARILGPLRGRTELGDAIEHFRRAATTAHSDRQVLDLLADSVVRPLDRQAYQCVSRAARDAGFGVTMSPFGVLDADIIVWRGLRMVREIAAVYGFRPGFFARAGLVRRILYTAATQGAADFVADALLSHVGARLAGLLSARVGEGVLSGMRMARLGIVTMAACRPLPFTEEDRASIAKLGSEVTAAIGSTGEKS